MLTCLVRSSVLAGWKSFWAWHILQAAYTGAANKDLGDEKCDVGFVADYCFGQDPVYSKNNPEEHIDGNVIEYLQVGGVQRVAGGGYGWRLRLAHSGGWRLRLEALARSRWRCMSRLSLWVSP